MKKCSKCPFECDLKEASVYFYTQNERFIAECKKCHNSRTKAWSKQNRNKRLKIQQKWNKSNSAYKANWYLKHRDISIRRARDSKIRNPESQKTSWERRRARELSVEVSDLSNQQWKNLLEVFEYRCAYCGSFSNKLTMDHIIPISKGGNHTKSNVVPACSSCNSSKQDKDVLVWLFPEVKYA